MSSQFPPTSYGGQRQLQVYLAGPQGQRPLQPVSPEALEQAANAAMTPEVRGYLDGMTDSMHANRASALLYSFAWRLLTLDKLLRNCSEAGSTPAAGDRHAGCPP